jgi:hypothetical protein
MRWRPLFVVMLAASLWPVAATASSTRKKVIVRNGRVVAVIYKFKQTSASPPGVGFLPGYRTPEQLRHIEYRPRYWYAGSPYYFGPPGWYHGRYTGGSFGPCWTSSPIGMQWTCGR